MLKHTPGPWKVELPKKMRVRPNSFEHGMKAIVMAKGSSCFGVATVEGPSNLDMVKEWEANARLIAQAPAMMLALKAIAEMKVDENTDFRQLSALCIAVAKIQLQILEE